ncbi:MAG TPA: hypothetical protein ENJ95_12375 [Bacteroidetes bacterium]|nr:hypothetical protein [Bacteroidota bacterium]
MKVLVAIVDDNAEVRSRIKAELTKRRQGDIVNLDVRIIDGEFDHPDKLIEYLENNKEDRNKWPDFIILDADYTVGLAEANLDECIKAVHRINDLKKKEDFKHLKNTRIIILSNHASNRNLFRGVYRYIDSYIKKEEYKTRLFHAIHHLWCGDKNTKYFHVFQHWKDEEEGKLSEMQWREKFSDGRTIPENTKKIWDCILHGETNIPTTLEIAASTVSAAKDVIFNHLIKQSSLQSFYERKKKNIDKTWAILMICTELRHPTIMSHLKNCGIELKK